MPKILDLLYGKSISNFNELSTQTGVFVYLKNEMFHVQTDKLAFIRFYLTIYYHP